MTRQNALPLVAMLPSLLAALATTATAQVPVLDTVQVTATREPESINAVPASISVVTDEQMRARGVHDLRGALALVAGVEITPGGDGGPAGSVPALWGLREFDAFLLVIDGVPAGGAFNPQLSTLSLENVQRIEVVRGSAPVMYGATSFVGVIHVIHYPAGQAKPHVGAAAGRFGSGRIAASTNIGAGLPQSLAFEGERRGLSGDDASYRRNHLLYRLGVDLADGTATLDLDASMIRQNPNSPVPRTGAVLDPLIPLDANYNPSDARLDETRLQAFGRYQRALDIGDWQTSLSYTHTQGRFIRGFLAEDYADAPPTNAEGFDQHRRIDDIYFDTHIETHAGEHITLTYGLDWLYGRARLQNRLFEYSVGLDGSSRPASGGQATTDAPAGADRRSFLGAYIQADWSPSDRFDVLAGLRLNHTRETARGDDPDGGPGPITVHRRVTKLSGSLGASWHLWRDGVDGLTLYGDIRNSYKPAALDFGPEAEGEILEPETARSFEAGLKGSAWQGALDWDLSAFVMDFDNLVVAQTVDGLPGLANAGKERMKGAEFEASYRIAPDLRLYGNLAWHDARFGDYVQLFGNTPTQLRGNRLEMSPMHLAGLGLSYAPGHGWQASIVGNRVGDRFLNKRNTARAPAYNSLAVSLGYRFQRCELRLSGDNLTDRRDPVAESELGEGQYYRLPARFFELGVDCSL